MKYLFFFLTFLITGIQYAQTTINGSFVHDGLTRTYSFYVPAMYDGSQPVPLILNLHGYTSNGAQQSFYGNFKNIADTAGFIVVHPDGTFDGSSNQFWNLAYSPGSVDDVGFLEALIDTISASYNINNARVYSTGMSNGGFMSYRLACESNRFAAIASVTGSMTTLMQFNCSPVRPTPVMEIHGTADAVVPYTGSTGVLSITSVLDYWANFNSCPTPPTMTNVPNINTGDGATAEHYVYSAGTNGVTMEHFKVIGGEHSWPGATFPNGVTCQDFSASKEIWRFFRQYSFVGAGLEENTEKSRLTVFPNPGNGLFSLQSEKTVIDKVQVSDLNGRTVFSQEHLNVTEQIDLSRLKVGIYLLKADGQTIRLEIIE
jgi:polyhydroxybutyrate depolymerase